MLNNNHSTVLLYEAVLHLVHDVSSTYIDCTFGRGGHSKLILTKLTNEGSLIAFDRDITAFNHGLSLAKKDPRFQMFHNDFTDIKKLPSSSIGGILLDLGVSSPQLDNSDRGFSFNKNGPLDMRMNQNQSYTAKDLIANIEEDHLVYILENFGEERFARKIAKGIVERRKLKPFLETSDLASVIAQHHPRWKHGKNPATKSFQAIRIAVNNELDQLNEVLESSYKALKSGGRLVVISFHSLEDRIVKSFLKDKSQKYVEEDIMTVKKIPQLMKNITKVKPSKDEIQNNIRSRSAIMRVAVKL